jgi:hypothetical protein
MYEKLLNETEKYLEQHKNKEIVFIDIWQELAERSEKLKFDMPDSIGDYEMLLEGDKRFIFVKPKVEPPSVDIGEEEGEYEVGEDFFEVEEIEKLGFNEKQIIALRKNYKDKNTEDEDDKENVFVPHLKTQTTKKITSSKKKIKKKKVTSPKMKTSVKRKK